MAILVTAPARSGISWEEVAQGGEGLSDTELCSIANLTLFAGFETTVHLLSNGVVLLMEHPDQLAGLRAVTASSTAIGEKSGKAISCPPARAMCTSGSIVAHGLQRAREKKHQRLPPVANRRFRTDRSTQQNVEGVLVRGAEQNLAGDGQPVLAVEDVKRPEQIPVVEVGKLLAEFDTCGDSGYCG